MLIGSCFYLYACQCYHGWLAGTRWLGQPARLQQWDHAAVGRFGLTACLGGFESLWKELLQITAVCCDILMSDLGTLECGTDEKLYKLINKTRDDAPRNLWIVKEKTLVLWASKKLDRHVSSEWDADSQNMKKKEAIINVYITAIESQECFKYILEGSIKF